MASSDYAPCTSNSHNRAASPSPPPCDLPFTVPAVGGPYGIGAFMTHVVQTNPSCENGANCMDLFPAMVWTTLGKGEGDAVKVCVICTRLQCVANQPASAHPSSPIRLHAPVTPCSVRPSNDILRHVWRPRHAAIHLLILQS